MKFYVIEKTESQSRYFIKLATRGDEPRYGIPAEFSAFTFWIKKDAAFKNAEPVFAEKYNKEWFERIAIGAEFILTTEFNVP